MKKLSSIPSCLCVGIWCLLLFPSALFAQQEKWTFLPVAPLFQPLIADPREPGAALIAYTTQTRYEGEVGTFFELLRWELPDNTRWGWGIFGSGNILLSQEGVAFPMLATDWYAGMYVSESSGDLSWRLEFEHESTHLGDSLEGTLEPIIYNGENFNLSTSLKPSENLRLYATVGAWENFFPTNNTLFASLGTELYTPAWDLGGTRLRGYGTFDLKYKDQANAWNKTVQMGLQWKFKEDESRAVRVALVYYNGNNEYGQFYLQSDDHWAVGFYFDP